MKKLLKTCILIVAFILLVGTNVVAIQLETNKSNNQDEGSYLLPIKVKNFFGFIDKNGQIIVKPVLNNVEREYYDDISIITINNSQNDLYEYALMSKAGTIIKLPERFNNMLNFREGLCAVSRYSQTLGQRWGFINKQGKIVINLDFQNAKSFSDGLAAVQINGRWGFVDKEKLVIPCQYRDVGSFKDGVAWVSDGWESHFIDKSGKKVSPDYVSPINIEEGFYGSEIKNNYNDGLAIVRKGSVFSSNYKYGFIDRNGNIIIQPEYEYVRCFKEGFAIVSKSEGSSLSSVFKYSFINTKGESLTEDTFLGAGDFNEGLAAVNINGNIGFISEAGDIVIKPRFEHEDNLLNSMFHNSLSYKFSEDYAAIKIANSFGIKKYGYIDKSGKLVINAIYESAEDFKDGYAIVKSEDGKCGVIDKDGKYIIQPEYTSIKRTQNKGIFRVYNSLNSWGYIEENGKLIWKVNAD